MASLEGDRKARVELIAAAHRFMLAAVPLRHPESENALAAFVLAAAASRRPAPDLDAVCLHTLAALNRCADGRIPTLTDRYLSLDTGARDAPGRFRRCVEELLRFRGLRSRIVQEAIAIIEERYAEPMLSLATVARDLRRNRTALATLFKAHIGLPVQEYLRRVRLNHAAGLLVTSAMSIKEIWVAVGYNDGSDFDRDFRRRFEVTPRDYRSLARLPVGMPPAGDSPDCGSSDDSRHTGQVKVLIVEDDDVSRDLARRYLTSEGHSVETAATGEDGVDAVVRTGPEVLLLDLHLPGIDGLECLRRVRQQRYVRQPAAALMTADWEAYEYADELETLGTRIVSKPCFLEDIGTLVTTLGGR